MPTSFWTLLFRIILQQPLSRVLLRTLFLVFPHFYSASSFWNSAHLSDCKLWDYYPVPRQVQPIRVFGKSLLLHHPNPERCFTKIQLEPLYVAPVWFWAKPPTWIFFFVLPENEFDTHLISRPTTLVRLWIFYLYFYLFYLRESRQRMEFLTFLQWDEHSVFSECRRSSEDGWLFEKFDICRRQFPQRGVWMGGTNTTAAQWGWVCPAGAPMDWWRWGGNTDAKNSELRRRIGSGRRAGLSAGLSRSTGTQKKERIFVSRLWLRMDDFALLVSPTVLLSPFVCLFLSLALSFSHFFFLPWANPTRETQEEERQEEVQEKKKNRKKPEFGGRGRFLFYTNVWIFKAMCGFGGAALHPGPAPSLSPPSQSWRHAAVFGSLRRVAALSNGRRIVP